MNDLDHFEQIQMSLVILKTIFLPVYKDSAGMSSDVKSGTYRRERSTTKLC